MNELSSIAGCILAGGQSRRMGEDKAFLTLAGTPLIARAIQRLELQVATLILNAHDDAEGVDAFGLPVVTDAPGDRHGPLGGILAALRWAETARIDWVVTAAVDTPFFPRDLVQRLAAARDGKVMAVASSGARLHPVFGLWKAGLAVDLDRAITKGLRSARQWVALHDAGIAQWPAEPYDPFFNLNRPEDLATASRILGEHRP